METGFGPAAAKATCSPLDRSTLLMLLLHAERFADRTDFLFKSQNGAERFRQRAAKQCVPVFGCLEVVDGSFRAVEVYGKGAVRVG